MPEGGATFAVSAPSLFDGETMLRDHCVVVAGERVQTVLPRSQCPAEIPLELLKAGTLAPGLIDLQVNGGGDVMFNNAPDINTLKTLQRAHRARGTTALLPTLLSDSRETQEAGFAAVHSARAAGNKGILGIHFEGPWFNPARRGAHRQDRLRAANSADIDWLCSLRGGIVMITLAPEQVRPEQVQRLAQCGVLVCAGHSEASFEQVCTAADHGLSGVTHLFNAMSQLRGREPGMVGAALGLDELWSGIIADGHHVHAAAIRLAATVKPPGKLLLVSDAMATVGGKLKQCNLYGEDIHEHDGRMVNSEGVLAGSAISLIDAVRYSHDTVALPLGECLRMASRYPAQVLGLGNELGRLSPGYRADLVHFDDNFHVTRTWVAGEALTHTR